MAGNVRTWSEISLHKGLSNFLLFLGQEVIYDFLYIEELSCYAGPLEKAIWQFHRAYIGELASTFLKSLSNILMNSKKHVAMLRQGGCQSAQPRKTKQGRQSLLSSLMQAGP